MNSEVPLRETCVLRYVLDRQAAERPDEIFATFDDGRKLTYADMLQVVRRTAAAFQALGVGKGDHVLSWLPTGLDAIRVWFALNYIGAVYMPLNLDYRGRLLEHAVQLSDARLIIVEGSLVDRLEDIGLATLDTAVVLGVTSLPEIKHLRVLGGSALDAPDEGFIETGLPIEPWDTQCIILTSGTTGRSKAVLSSYFHLYSLCGPDSWQYVNDNDRFLINLPLFHMGGTSCIYAMLLRGASIAVTERFRTQDFWSIVRDTKSTVVGLMGAMTTFLMSAPASPDDRSHGLRVAVIIPLLGDIQAFADRFCVEVYTVYNMTEISTPLVSDRNPTDPGVCGRPRPGVDLRIVDANDIEVPEGASGELVIRTDRPWAMSHGYYKDPEATARAWRNGWFHTGDSFRRDEKGQYYFVDRQKDVIRRRGENISSFEVEGEVGAHPDVKDVAALAVPSEFGEDEVLVAVIPRDGAVIDPAELIAFCAKRMPRFMVPRYVRVMDDFPRTPTAKVQKHLLREDGITVDVFDRARAGIDVR